MFILVVRQLFIMLLIAFSGYIVTKKFAFGEKEQKFVSKILTYFINPCLIISRFNMDFNLEKLKSLSIVFLLSFVIHFAMLILSVLFIRKRTFIDKDLADIERVGIVFTNCGFIGIPLISGVFPESNGVFYLLAYIVCFNFLLWTVGYYMICGRINLKNVITNPNILALVIGLLIFCLPFTLPEVIASTINSISSMNTAMAMFLLGMLFVTFGSFKKEYLYRALKVCLVKYVFVAALVLLIVFGANYLLQGIQEIRLICYVCFIAALCPVGMTVSSFAVLFGKDESYTAFLTLMTSLVSLFMLPLSVLLAEHIF
ncbi:MAG: AEC family transporter [Treponema sp.]|nr:AEC family transporter [Treponema sp.]